MDINTVKRDIDIVKRLMANPPASVKDNTTLVVAAKNRTKTECKEMVTIPILSSKLLLMSPSINLNI